MNILIKNILADKEEIDIFIKGNIIEKTGENLEVSGVEKIIDGKGKAVIPGFVNGHTHAAMTLFRGYGDDLNLKTWLNEYIWPAEAKLTDEDIYWGAKLACLEMIKSGTTCFNDMYWKTEITAQAAKEMGIRCFLGESVIDNLNPNRLDDIKNTIKEKVKLISDFPEIINITLAPHAVYTVSAETFKWIAEFAKDNNLLIHTHLSETSFEVSESIRIWGVTPVKYLYNLGVLGPNVISAHSLWLTDEDINILSDTGTKVVHNPNSNLKLGSGYMFRYNDLNNKGIVVSIGTDGCSSSNNLDMCEALKVASLLQKGWHNDPTVMTAHEALKCGTENGGKLFGINTGKIEEGYLADLALIDLNTPAFTPNHNFISNLIYSAHGDYIDTVICNGQILMENKHVIEEDEILQKASESAYRIIKNNYGKKDSI